MVVVVVEIPIVADGEFVVGMEFSSKEAVIMAIKYYTIRRGVDYQVYESEPLTFYAKCTQIFEDGLRLVTSKLHANQLASRNIQVNCFDKQNDVFEVREMPSEMEYVIDLRRQQCDCGMFPVHQISCRHVFACCANQLLDWQVYAHDVYKMDQIRRIYRVRFRPLKNLTTWPAYNGSRFVPNPFLR
ncbi:hypothetical protein Ahy_A02g007665 [Arachis hypogaea]|uniref:SWIM-type domain-containing protein n=1 Tax=Arachis hypogaea TaxID=3818 RepID=A0A445ECV2_ARAHY|nr:hypothetical protein Ahy_A02g007665 [Arachis hypogaea]